MDFQECRGKIYDPALYSPDQMMGKSLWSVLEEYSNGMLNEMYTVESTIFGHRPKPQLVLRERPFPSDDKKRRSWIALTTHFMHPGDVKGRQMSKGAPESRFNYWLLDAKGLERKLIQERSEHTEGRPVRIRADKKVQFQSVATAMNLCKKHGFRDIHVAMDKD